MPGEDKVVTDTELAGGKMVGIELIDGELVGTELTDGELVGTELTGGELVGTELTGEELVGTELTGEEMVDTELTGGEMVDTELTGGELVCTKLTLVGFEDFFCHRTGSRNKIVLDVWIFNVFFKQHRRKVLVHLGSSIVEFPCFNASFPKQGLSTMIQ